jgi:hypothetical protein
MAGMFLTDLAYVNDATPDYINSLMNVDKMDQMVGVVRGIQLSFQSPYCLEEVPHIQVPPRFQPSLRWQSRFG